MKIGLVRKKGDFQVLKNVLYIFMKIDTFYSIYINILERYGWAIL